MSFIIFAPMNKRQITRIKNLTEDGKIFSAKFKKKDGTIRTINCRRNVKKYVTGKGMSYSPEERGHLIVFDMANDGYRTINLNELLWIRIGGITFKSDKL